jgi:hypothetical protein
MYSWVSMEFRRPGIPSTWNSVDTNPVDTKFRRHGIPHIIAAASCLGGG